MDSKTPPPSNLGTPAANPADKLRELQERAQATIAAQRARVGQLESKLTEQLDLIEAVVAAQLPTPGGDQGSGDAAEELAALRRELAETKAAWATAQQHASDATGQVQQLSELQGKLDHRSDELASGRREIESRQQALDDRATQLNARERELRHVQDELDARSQELARQQSQFAFTESGLSQRESELAANEFALEATRQTLANREAAVQTTEQNVAAREAELQASLQGLEVRETALQATRQQIDRDQAELAAFETERFRLNEQVANLTQENLAHGGELAAQLAQVRQELAAQQMTSESERNRFEEERAKFEQQHAALASERDELSAALSSAQERLTAAETQSDAAAERDELQQKFDLALADMQTLRSRTAELEQELASRPPADQADSVELVRLRAERESLLTRVAELEQQPPAPVETDSSQQIADLQRRFELAVEDVRDLKKQNAQLESQLKASKPSGAAPAGPPGKNWEAVKQQLLASLENESGSATPEQQKEHASIANTVRITDEIVATKDRRIAELESQLSDGGRETGMTVSDAVMAVNDPTALIDADAVIQEHRGRIAALEHEMEEKLRQTEIALSMERAKIAREQSQLTELRIELEAMRGPNGTGGEAASGGGPRRRWLSKLGLGDEDKK